MWSRPAPRPFDQHQMALQGRGSTGSGVGADREMRCLLITPTPKAQEAGLVFEYEAWPMARFYFHVRQRNCRYEDRQGADLFGPLEAWAHAIENARQLIDDDALSGSIEEHWVEIEDAAGGIVVMPFARSLPLN